MAVKVELLQILVFNVGPRIDLVSLQELPGWYQVVAWALCAQTLAPPQEDTGKSFLGSGSPFALVDNTFGY